MWLTAAEWNKMGLQCNRVMNTWRVRRPSCFCAHDFDGDLKGAAMNDRACCPVEASLACPRLNDAGCAGAGVCARRCACVCVRACA